MPPKITLSKPPKPTGPPKPKAPLLNFAAESPSESSSDSDTPSTAFSKSKTKPKSKPKPKSAAAKDKARVNAQLAASSSSTTTTTAPPPPADLDPTIYDYDTAWDSMSTLRTLAAAPTAADAERRPKYMASLLSAAEVRKRDALIAKERALAKEREAEGEEYADKETFVTDAYRRQRAELAAEAAAEREKEEREEKRRREAGGGGAGFWRGVLERGEERHGALVEAGVKGVGGEGGRGGEGGGRVKEKEVEKVKEKGEAELARERGVEVNEEGAVVDKTQLLEGGLNVSAKPRGVAAGAAAARGGERKQAWQGVGGKREDARLRQSRMVEEQLAAAHKRALDAEEEEKKNLERAAKSRKTEGEVMGARERYLQRKREAEEKKKAGGA
ncbi:coiled-coil domain-containing protein 55 [Morchella snyderi]|nr:coiled-coil domain-containing protein 55 [Morchella snyderi]